SEGGADCLYFFFQAEDGILGRTVTGVQTCALPIYLAGPRDKVLVARARKIQRFLAQPLNVAKQFTGLEGVYVKVADTVRSFKERSEERRVGKEGGAVGMS